MSKNHFKALKNIFHFKSTEAAKKRAHLKGKLLVAMSQTGTKKKELKIFGADHELR